MVQWIEGNIKIYLDHKTWTGQSATFQELLIKTKHCASIQQPLGHGEWAATEETPPPNYKFKSQTRLCQTPF
jgi:hypothetical protein